MAVMNDPAAPSEAITIIGAMITPAFFILGTTSLVASVLVRMARIVDRARILASVAHEGSWEQHGADHTVVSTGRSRLRKGRKAGAGRERICTMVVGTTTFWLTRRASGSIPVFTAHRSTPHAVTLVASPAAWAARASVDEPPNAGTPSSRITLATRV
jgi:hypothetical protein